MANDHWMLTSADMLSLFQEQARLVSFFFNRFDSSIALEFVREVDTCKGTVFFSGVGKSGFISNKIAMSFASVGVKSAFLNPQDALHGDIGNLQVGDLLVLLSKSGSTEELVKLVPSARSKGSKIVSITCAQSCTLAEMSDMHVYLPLERELCTFNTAPVTSTILQLIFGDTITAALMRVKRLSMERYALNHPSGSIGRRLTLRVKDRMMSGASIPRIQQSSSISDAIFEMTRCGIGCVLVMDASDTLIGIFTDGDLRRMLQASKTFYSDFPIVGHITTNPRVVSPDHKLTEAKEIMSAPTLVSSIPVVGQDDDILVGILTLSDLLIALE